MTPEQIRKVVPRIGEPFGVWRESIGPYKLRSLSEEDRFKLHHVTFDAARHAHHLAHATDAVPVGCDVEDYVDATGNGRDDEPAADILAGEQRQSAQFRHSLAG